MRDREVGDAQSSIGSVVTSSHWMPEHKLPAITTLTMITGSGYREQFVPQIVKNLVKQVSIATPIRSNMDSLGVGIAHCGTESPFSCMLML